MQISKKWFFSLLGWLSRKYPQTVITCTFYPELFSGRFVLVNRIIFSKLNMDTKIFFLWFVMSPNWKTHPTITAVKMLLRQLKFVDGVKLDYFMDLHAHSTATGAFTYCNLFDEQPKKVTCQEIEHILDLKWKTKNIRYF